MSSDDLFLTLTGFVGDACWDEEGHFTGTELDAGKPLQHFRIKNQMEENWSSAMEVCSHGKPSIGSPSCNFVCMDECRCLKGYL